MAKKFDRKERRGRIPKRIWPWLQLSNLPAGNGQDIRTQDCSDQPQLLQTPQTAGRRYRHSASCRISSGSMPGKSVRKMCGWPEHSFLPLEQVETPQFEQAVRCQTAPVFAGLSDIYLRQAEDMRAKSPFARIIRNRGFWPPLSNPIL